MAKRKTPINKNSNFLLIFAVSLISLIIFILYINNLSINKLQNTIIKDDLYDNYVFTTDWRTYEDPDYKFEFKYPKDLIIEVENGGNDMPPSIITKNEPKFIRVYDQNTKLLNISINPEGYYGHQYINKGSDIKQGYTGNRQAEIYTQTDNTGYYLEKLYKIKNITLTPNFSIVVDFHKSKTELLDSIISTFKFTN